MHAAVPDDVTADSCVAAHRTLLTPEMEIVLNLTLNLNLILQKEKKHREVISHRTNRKD